MEQVITFGELIRIIKRHVGLIVGTTLIFTVLAAVYTFIIVTPQYEASTQLIIVQKESGDDVSAEQSNIQMTRLINTSKDIIENPIILSPVKQKLASSEKYNIKLSKLEKEVSVTNEANSQLVVVNVNDSNADRAARIANLVAQSFKGRAKEMLDIDNVMITAATAPENPVSPNKRNNLIFGIVLGLFFGFIFTLVSEALNRRVNDEEFLTKRMGVKVIGNISRI
ncbi:capsular polysaccharide biosynthesis protein [Lapidilactobacillus concavus DSM 17758]|uniref:Capsular polysaccharide biosynthesis protein CpsC n=1 Tax=Lapidilactobacillus concavus DSM 17758 TaxID=1423735 RepID=A0A0R1VTE9_9LACO|nr:Wzz/FepE/Etk N-terminal domain-containing protein [Lapidilactobacillus concavus]KRM08693.1 capsular polysaccharide biosynthesis protein [Lapidilactobacillus concavus DSM 17758]GEL13685.1 polysaccharide biosynthesis protein [Lapidilactobacillus concavus]